MSSYLETVDKAKGLPVGTTRTWRGGRKVTKVAPGKWVEQPDSSRSVGAARRGEVKLSQKQLAKVLKKGNYTIISAGRNPNDPKEAALPEDHKTFKLRHEKLRADIERSGFQYTEVVGHYGGVEASFVVFHTEAGTAPAPTKAPPKGTMHFMVHHKRPTEYAAMRALGKKYNQDSVIHSRKNKHELHYVTGSNAGSFNAGAGHEYLPEASDYYTVAEHPDGEPKATKFSLNFDWDVLKSAADAMLKSLKRIFGRGLRED